MKEQTQSAIRLLEALTERAKELTCLYAIEETLKEPDADIDRVCEHIIQAIPPGWQFPDICVAKITLEDKEYCSPGFTDTPWQLIANIEQQDQVVGCIVVCYTREMPVAHVGPFLKEEEKLIQTIADRLNHFLTYKKMSHVFQEWQKADRDVVGNGRSNWEAVLDLIRQTDHALFLRISNKMLNHLCWTGIEEAESLRLADGHGKAVAKHPHGDQLNDTREGSLLGSSTEFIERIFRIAANHLGSEEILSRIQMWIEEDKLAALLRTVRGHLPLSEVASSLRRYFFATREEMGSRYPMARGLRVLLIERILSAQFQYINRAKNHVDIEDLYHLIQKVIFSTESHGKLGGKSAGLFLAATILNQNDGESSSPIRIPRTWYISSDMMLEFIHYNNMDEVIEQKYKDIERVRLEYPHVIEMFRSGAFPPEMISGLSSALDDLGDKPLVVRSSSLLEERTETPFVDKYCSVFLGNQGTREERLGDLMRAVAEVYASNFGPIPIEYRAEHGLLEFSEQMGVMIQEVVGTQIGPYFFPAYSGVARGRNGLQWLPDVSAEDGLMRILPGLGTRASDRSSDWYPVLVIPGRPSVQLDGTVEDCIRRAPKCIDVINLETNRLQTLDLDELMRRHAEAYPKAELVVSLYENGQIRQAENASALTENALAVTFNGLINRSPFIAQIRSLLRTLEEAFGVPVEIEFASDGENIYLVQCCPQVFANAPRPAPIPKDIAKDDLVFSATRHVPNGSVRDITHVLYVRPAVYESLTEDKHRQAVREAVAELNGLLPKRQFVLMAPGSWAGSVDHHTSVELRYDDFRNAVALIDLSPSEIVEHKPAPVGAHFLQDLLEAGIIYLQLPPEDGKVSFNERVLLRARNALPELLPEYAFLADAIRVVDVAGCTDGKLMHVLMNADLGQAVGFFSDPRQDVGTPEEGETLEEAHPETYWRWRHRLAEQIASRLDPVEFGVEGIYLFGSTKNGTAGPASDIDILIHFTGTPAQRADLNRWLDGWSLCLDEINYLRTGYRSGGLLDVHIVTDEDIAQRTSYAVKINAVTDAARPLKTRSPEILA